MSVKAKCKSGCHGRRLSVVGSQAHKGAGEVNCGSGRESEQAGDETR